MSSEENKQNNSDNVDKLRGGTLSGVGGQPSFLDIDALKSKLENPSDKKASPFDNFFNKDKK